MFLIIFLTAFLFFLFIGSFLNVVIERVYRGEQFVKGRSYCVSCKHELSVFDLVPVFSFLFLKGRCRYCKKSIPRMHVVIELFTAICAGFIFATYPFIQALFFSLILIVLILIFFTDLMYYVIPDIYLYLLIAMYVIGAALLYVYPNSFYFLGSLYSPIWGHVRAALISSAFFGILYLGSKGKAMGEGDIYLSGILALFLGPTLSLVMLFISFLTGAIVGVILVSMGRKRITQVIPFGPFLIVGFTISYLVGFNLINLYLGLL